MNSTRNICVITGTRAEYGILFPLLKRLKNQSTISLQIIATGAHLSPAHGNTFREIEKDGFKISKTVDMLLSGDSSVACVKSTGLALVGFADALRDLSPNLVIVLGDRYEMHAAATACALMSIPICHIAGGEITEGAFDDALRHSISKMASLHFTGHQNYSNRLLQMGAQKETVINTGSLAMDNIFSEPLLSREDLEEQLEFRIKEPLVVLTYHPETRSKDPPLIALNEILKALDSKPELSIVITEPNADPGASEIKARLNAFAESRSDRVRIYSSLGRKRFLSLLPFAKAVIGNSSSGLSEAPAFRIGTINIGDRQKGRLMPPSVITVNPLQSEITAAIDRIMSLKFKDEIAGCDTFFGDGHAAEKMIEILAAPNLETRISNRFNDLV